jgi:hypothetical protein
MSSCPCVICNQIPYGPDATIVGNVERHGWGVVAVPGTFDLAYTVGLWHSYGLPEMAMFGLQAQNMAGWLNECVDVVRADGWPEGAFGGVLDGFDTQLRGVHESWRDAFFGTAYRFYRSWPVPVAQLVWPDAAGRWPWEPEATLSSRARQAFTWLPVSDHPPGSWHLLGVFGDSFPLQAEPDSWALTTRSVLSGSVSPSLVVYDEDGYDVLDARGHAAPDLCLAYLGELVLRHPSLRGLAGLPDGSVAIPASDGGWARSPLTAHLREISTRAWRAKPEPAV